MATNEPPREGLLSRLLDRGRLERERDYLLLWVRHRRDDGALDGLSAKELTRVAFGFPRRRAEFPRDVGDLGRCERAFEAMPRHLQRRVRPLLDQWRGDVADIERSRGR